MNRVIFQTATALLLFIVLASSGEAQENSAPAPPRAISATRTKQPPRIDGKLDDPVWQAATPCTGFVQSFPNPGKPASFETEVRLLYDGQALYVGARCLDPDPDKIIARVTRRDRWIESDWFEVHIDSRNGKRNGYFFSVNAAGVEMDGVWFDESEQNTDWDGVWDARTRITSVGWNVEMRIPLHLLRFAAGHDVSFGIEFQRRVARLNEWDQWQYIPPASSRWVSRFGTLTNLDLDARPFYFEIAPYAAVKTTIEDGAFASAGEAPFDAGVDGKVGLGSDFMLTMTANPDFGQVEVDQVVLNLSTIETYFPEKRPFFLEDKTLFMTPQFGDGTLAELFYTRRIGRAPRPVELADDEESLSEPRMTHIYGAAKLAGNVGRFSMGLLQAVTSREDAHVRLAGGGEINRLAEPLSSFSILRLKQGFWDHSALGLMATAMATPSDGSAVTGGSDLQMELLDKKYQLTFKTLFSYLSDGRVPWHDDFTRAAIERDGNFGYGGDLVFRKVSGESLVGAVGGTWRSPTLALNDMGYQDRQDLFMAYFWLQYRRLKPLGELARIQINANGWLYRNASFLRLGDGFNLNGTVTFKNNWYVGAYAGSQPRRCDDRETRSAGKVTLCSERFPFETWLWAGSDQLKLFSASLEFGFYSTEHGYDVDLKLDLLVNPSARLQLELIPGFTRRNGDLRWIDTQDLAGGERYLFADRHTEVWDVTLRSTLTFTTTLTLQAYAQIFMASVDYGAKLAAPVPAGSIIHVADLMPAADVADDYDFADSALNLSIVLRWEYLPGSVAYLVYSGAFGDDRELAEFRFGRLMDDLLTSPARHVLMLKISYLWS